MIRPIALGRIPAIVGALLLGAASLAVPTSATAQARLQAGVLACSGDGGWGLIVTSRKTFRCTFSSDDGATRSEYTAVIRKVGIDLGVTGDTALLWIVLGPANRVGADFVPGSLAGDYAGVGADASVVVGGGANALVGGGQDSFALQPISIQVQTGVSVAAGVQFLNLQYVGPLN